MLDFIAGDRRADAPANGWPDGWLQNTKVVEVVRAIMLAEELRNSNLRLRFWQVFRSQEADGRADYRRLFREAAWREREAQRLLRGQDLDERVGEEAEDRCVARFQRAADCRHPRRLSLGFLASCHGHDDWPAQSLSSSHARYVRQHLGNREEVQRSSYQLLQ